MLSSRAWRSLASLALIASLSVPALVPVAAPISDPAWISGLTLIT
jgi:hypothetical protein